MAEWISEPPTGPPATRRGGIPLECVHHEVPEGSLLALYTDGLIEARRRDADAGLHALRGALADAAASSLETTCDKVLKALLDERPTDDAVLLIARTRAGQRAHRRLGPPQRSGGRRRRPLSGDRPTPRLGAGRADLRHRQLVVSELVTNAIRYGGAPIQLRLIKEKTLICEVSDASSTSPHLRCARIFDEGGRGLTPWSPSSPSAGGRDIPAPARPSGLSSPFPCGNPGHQRAACELTDLHR